MHMFLKYCLDTSIHGYCLVSIVISKQYYCIINLSNRFTANCMFSSNKGIIVYLRYHKFTHIWSDLKEHRKSEGVAQKELPARLDKSENCLQN